MRNLFSLIIFLLAATQLFAQSPNKFSYQAVVRDANGGLIQSSSVGMQVSILVDSATGTAVYVETQVPTSNANGLVSIEIGGGSVQSGDFSAIDWADGPYFIKTEMDPTGGTNYSITATSQLLSVPFALHATIADSVIKGADDDGDPLNEIQTISRTGTTVTLSNGGGTFQDSIGVGSPENLTMIQGTFSPTGSLFAGSGFTVTKNGTGDFTINFDTPFAAFPAVVFTPNRRLSGSQYVVRGDILGGSSYRVWIIDIDTGNRVDFETWLSFVAVGRR